MTAYLVFTGFTTGIALIAAVGAQNAYLLRQGLRRQHVLPLVLLGALSDVLLIGAAVLGVGAIIDSWPPLITLARWGGGLFVIGYGLSAAWRAMRPSRSLEAAAAGGDRGLMRSLVTMGALTWLNPHLYLDITILGSIANGHGPDGRWSFYVGMVLASVAWFSALGFGSTRLQPLFARPRSWQVLDVGIAVVMLALGIGLLMHWVLEQPEPVRSRLLPGIQNGDVPFPRASAVSEGP